MTRLSSKGQLLTLGLALGLVVAVFAGLGLYGAQRVSGEATATPTPPPTEPRPEPPPAPAIVLAVSPTGNDGADGSPNAPLRTIQAALDRATPGTLITLAPGVYRENLVTVRDGRPGAPITIKGPESGKDRAGRYQATLYGTGPGAQREPQPLHLRRVHHRRPGEAGEHPVPDRPGARSTAFKNGVQPQVADGRLIYVGRGRRQPRHHRRHHHATCSSTAPAASASGCATTPTATSIADSVIQYCGMFGKGDDDDDRAKYHNGEGVYIGTSPNSDEAADAPQRRQLATTWSPATSSSTFGSECFNVKENAHDNVFSDNVCTGNTESAEHDGSNVELRGFRNVVRNNQISGSAGYTLKIKSDDEEYDRGGNVVENNRLSGSAAALMIESAAAQGPMCGNVVATRVMVDGDFAGDLTAPC